MSVHLPQMHNWEQKARSNWHSDHTSMGFSISRHQKSPSKCEAGTDVCLAACIACNSTFNVNDFSGSHVLWKSLHTPQVSDAYFPKNGHSYCIQNQELAEPQHRQLPSKKNELSIFVSGAFEPAAALRQRAMAGAL